MNITFLVLADFLLSNLYWIVALGTLLLVVLYLFFDSIKGKKEKKKTPIIDEGAYMEALGGKDNIVTKNLEGSRIVLTLHDYEAIDRDKLRDAGVAGFVLMSDKLTLVIKDDANAVYKKLFPNG
jgi:phosphotransferase system IIB component